MLMVVIGAGASFDSVHPFDYGLDSNGIYRPPLAKELFDPRASFLSAVDAYPACRPLIAQLRTQVRASVDVETALEELVRRAEQGEKQLPRQLMAIRFYLHWIIDECGEKWARGRRWCNELPPPPDQDRALARGKQ